MSCRRGFGAGRGKHDEISSFLQSSSVSLPPHPPPVLDLDVRLLLPFSLLRVLTSLHNERHATFLLFLRDIADPSTEIRREVLGYVVHPTFSY